MAAADLDQIEAWIGESSAAAALAFIDDIERHCKRLAEQQIKLRFVPELGADLRVAVHGN